ncbi:MAG: hypothetical protein WAK95_16180 [Desulfobacterales bacterium]
MKRKPKLAVWKFASCDGCQLALLDCEELLPALADAVDIAYFPELSKTTIKGRYDISLVEGAITSREACQRIRRIREGSDVLVTIGACAAAGGIQALRNFVDTSELAGATYPEPGVFDLLGTATPIADHVRVDIGLFGCPINKVQLIGVIAAILQGRRPEVAGFSVCIECKLKGCVCLIVTRGTLCLGPVTRAGCGALCPGHDRGCYGCFGPSDSVNGEAMGRLFDRLATPKAEIVRIFRTFNAAAPDFRRLSEPYEKEIDSGQSTGPR